MTAIALVLAASLVAATPPPATPRAPTDTRFGITLEDPDRWLEDQQNPAAREWVQGHADDARRVLDSIPARAEVLADIERLENATATSLDNVVLMKGDRLLLQRQAAGEDMSKLYLREGFDGDERLVLDPEDWKKETGKTHAISYFEASPDGRLVVVGLSESGSEMAAAHVVDIASGKVIEAPITRVRFGVSWLPDGSGFFYNRENEAMPGQPASERQLDSQAYFHKLGTDAENDALVFGNRHDESLGIERAQLPMVQARPGSDWLMAFPYSVDNCLTGFVAPLADFTAGKKLVWRKILSPSDGVREVVQRGDFAYLLSAKTPNRSIEKMSLAPGAARTVVVPAGLEPIDWITGSGDALYYVTKPESGVGSRLYRQPWDSTTSTALALPGMDSVFPFTVQAGAQGIVVGGTGWAQFPSAVHVDARGKVHATALQPAPAGVDASQLVSDIVEATSHDGTRVPLSIVHRKDLKRDGNAPTLLSAYGAYGFSTEPALVPAHFAYFDRGFVRAFCHVRGGGEKGEAWYRAGFQASKSNTWKDLIACAEYLVEHGYTRPAKLAAMGTSAGGVMIGNAMVERPDLFGVMIPNVGVLDSVGAALRDPNGPVNWPEFGDPNTEEGFKALVGMSAYHKIKDGAAFPAVLLTHGYNDPRVAVWHSAKFAARLMRATDSGKPVMLDVDYDAGHGMDSSQSSINRKSADIISFILWQFKAEGYSPRTSGP